MFFLVGRFAFSSLGRLDPNKRSRSTFAASRFANWRCKRGVDREKSQGTCFRCTATATKRSTNVGSFEEKVHFGRTSGHRKFSEHGGVWAIWRCFWSDTSWSRRVWLDLFTTVRSVGWLWSFDRRWAFSSFQCVEAAQTVPFAGCLWLQDLESDDKHEPLAGLGVP